MDSGIILIVVLIIIGFAITWSNQGQVQEIEKRQSQFTRERQAMAEHDNKSASEVDADRNSMIETLEASSVFIIEFRSSSTSEALLLSCSAIA